jgi:hypothetical protein
MLRKPCIIIFLLFIAFPLVNALTVYQGNDLFETEVEYVKQRREKYVRPCLSRNFGPKGKSSNVNFAIGGSGGGYRAMLGTWVLFLDFKICSIITVAYNLTGGVVGSRRCSFV